MSGSRRDEILTRAAKLFSERGVAGTTVRDIADEVGILSGSLYHYFGSKDDIATEIVVRFLHDLIAGYERGLSLARTARERLEALITCSLETAIRHPYASEICQNENILSLDGPPGPAHESVVEMRGYWLTAIGDGVDQGELRSDVERGRIYQMLREAVWSSARANRPLLPESAAALRHDLIAVFLDGVATSGGVRQSSNTIPVEEPSSAPTFDLEAEIRALHVAIEGLQAQLRD